MTHVLLVIAPDGFRDEELFDTKTELERAGIQTTVASTHVGICHGKMGGTAESTVTISDIDLSLYDAVAFIGGGGAQVLFDDINAHTIAKTMTETGKVVGAICIAPVILARAGLLDGKRATVHPTGGALISVVSNASLSPESVVVDGKLVTGNGPEAAHEFGKTLVRMLTS